MLQSRVASSSSENPSETSQGREQWWNDLRRGSVYGPRISDERSGAQMPILDDVPAQNNLAEYLLGSKTHRKLLIAQRDEAQRVWDAMRASAWQRYQRGEMPEWFDVKWIMQVGVWKV